MYCVIFRPVCVLLVVLLSATFLPRLAQGHVTADSMPDSVAEMEYQIFLEFQPEDQVVLNKLGMVYYRLKKYKEAVIQFSKVLKMNPNNYDALDGMGLVKAAQGKYDEAISYHLQAVAVNAEDTAGYYHLGSVLEKKGRFREAAAAYQNALAKFNEQYPAGTTDKKAAELLATIKSAIRSVETRME